MKLNLFAIVSLLGCANNAVLASTCSESSGMCVCSGDCPSFTNDWASQSSDIISKGAESTCVATKTSSSTSISDGVVIINNQPYTIIDPCTSATTGSSAGMFDAFYATVLVAAAGVVGGFAAL